MLTRRSTLGLLAAVSALPSRALAHVAPPRNEIREGIAKRFTDLGGRVLAEKVAEVNYKRANSSEAFLTLSHSIELAAHFSQSFHVVVSMNVPW